MNPFKDYREQAHRVRRLAAQATDPGVQEQLVLTATEYDEMADEVERAVVEERSKKTP